MARTAKKKLRILDEGVELVADADSIDFSGAGVAGNFVANDVFEVIPAGRSITVSSTAPPSPTLNDLWAPIP